MKTENAGMHKECRCQSLHTMLLKLMKVLHFKIILVIIFRSFGRRENSFIREKNELKTKLDDYNSYYKNVTKNQISSREVNGRFVFEGIMKVYWGTEASVRLKEYDDTRVININNRNRKAMSVGPDFVHTGK